MDTSLTHWKTGVKVDCWDKEIDVALDLLDDTTFNMLHNTVKADEYGVLAQPPPCSSFSSVRDGDDGPPPLRGPEAPDIYMGTRT